MALALEDPRPEPALGRRPAAATRAERPGGARPRRLGRRSHRALLLTHVLASVGWFGVAVTVAFTAFVGSSRGEVAFFEVVEASLWLSVPLGLTAAATGVVLSLTTRWGLVRYWWVVAKEVITIAAIVTDVLIVGPEISQAIDSGATTHIPDPVIAHCVVLALATGLSVIKPKARTPLAGDRAAGGT